MSLRSKSINVDLTKHKPGLVFDADGITLLGKYTDELAAYRAKKHWVEVLNSYFLLERDRDYEMWVASSFEDQYYVLSCSFTSACGRYAFWRLVNRQAPEAEERLRGHAHPASVSSVWTDNAASAHDEHSRWILSAICDQIDSNEETASLISKIMKLFR